MQRFFLFISVTLAPAACQPIAPTPTAPPIVLTHTPPPPTTTLIPFTATLTLTPLPPTDTPTPPPPIPTADFTLADLIGAWTRSDRDAGDLFLVFDDDGRYLASHGSPEVVMHSGRYTLEDRLFTFVDGWNCAPLPKDTPGRYVVRIANKGQWLFFDLYSDSCPDRPASLRSVRWTRYAP